jgi:hypothetical protein
MSRFGLADDLGDPPVHDQNFTKVAYHHVGGLEVAMDD